MHPAAAGPLARPDSERVLVRLGEARRELAELEACREQLTLMLSIPVQLGKTNSRRELLVLVNQIALVHRRIADLSKRAAL